MPINSLEFAQKFTGILDKEYVQKSVTGFFADNVFRSHFVGANSVKIPYADFSGLSDYDRDTGFARGAITLQNEIFTLAMDRARSLQIDREDADETGVAELAGRYGTEFVRTKVVPECDAYVLSKIAGVAKTRGQHIPFNMSAPIATLSTLINQVRMAVGYDEELIAFVDSYTDNIIENSTEISKHIMVSDFKQGEINKKVKKYNGVSIIPVVPERMKTAYTFKVDSGNDHSGGFAPTANAVGIHIIVMPKKSAHLIRKTEKVRVFSPDVNQGADAYRFDYRIYYDVLVKRSELPSIWGAFAPSVAISSDVSATATKTAGSITGSLSVTAAASDSSTLAYQWYYGADANGANAFPIAGATSASWTIDTALTAGTYYVFCKIFAGGGSTEKKSTVCTLTVS